MSALPASLARVHMIGIGGAGMSGVARLLLARGAQVSGSDAKGSGATAALQERGALVRLGHDAAALDMLPGGATSVVSTHAAIPRDNPELLEAQRRGVPVLLRPVVLAMLMAGHRNLVVTGTAGKTTTTSMLVAALRGAGLDPSFAVGGDLDGPGTNAHHGRGGLFVAEADESDGSLLAYTPDVAVVTNIEADHLDFFGSAQAYAAVFDRFADGLGAATLVVCADDPGAAALGERAAAAGTRVLRYGSATGSAGAATGPALDAALVAWEQHGVGATARIMLAGEDAPRTMALAVPGRHMALNALGALLAAGEAGAAVEDVLDALAGFGGVRRRFERVGRAGGVTVFDDYAHHPTKVRAALSALLTLAREPSPQHPDGGRAVVVFQPHLYSRTVAFAEDFGAALGAADLVFVLDVYGAREAPLPGVSGATVAAHVTAPVHHLTDPTSVARTVAAACRPGDVVVTMGAGDVTALAPQLLRALGTASVAR